MLTGPVFFHPAHCADSDREGEDNEDEGAPTLGSAIVDVPVPEVRRVRACPVRRKRRWQSLAIGNTSSCTTCCASSDVADDSTAGTNQPTTTIRNDVVDHVVQLPCHVTDASPVALPGQRYKLDDDDVRNLTDMIKRIAWPSNARRVVRGKGECLGATNDANGARLGKNTGMRAEFCKAFNQALARAIGDIPFHWGSLQVNVDSISEEHRDANNTGLSAIVLLGEFTGGRFTMSDQSHSLTTDDRGTALIIDGSQLHYSEPFEGYRISVVAFLHKATMDLASSQLEYLRSLGFRLPCEALPEPCTHVTHGGEDWPCMACGAFWSDSGAFRTPGYGGAWDEYGPIKPLGFKSARGLTPGPSLMHVHGLPR